MSEYLAAAAQALSAPEVIVRRSAEARAKATGSDVDSVLAAWAGGQSLAPAPTPAPAPAAAAVAEPTAAPSVETTPPPAVEQPVNASVGVAVMEPPVAEPDERHPAAPLADRIRIASRVGAVSGVVLALLGWLFASQFIIGQAGVAGEEGAESVVFGVVPGTVVLAAMLISIVIGITVAGLARMLPGWTSPGMQLTGSAVPSTSLGIVLGGVVGALGGGIIAGLATPPELPDDPYLVPAAAALIWGLLVWAAGGWLIGALVQAMGVPEGVEVGDLDEVATVKGRLVTAFGLPLVAAVAILALVLSFAFVFISFPSWSPLTGTVIAASILGFAALSASKPNMKVGLQELVVAAAGIGTVVILIYAVLQTTGAGEHHEEEGAEHSTTEEAPAEGDARISVAF